MMKKTWNRFLAAVLALCLCTALIPAASAATNDAGLPIEDITLTAAAQERSSRGYTVTYTASLAQGVGDTYAKIVAVNKDDTDNLKALRFTCTLTDSLIAQMPDATLTQDQFSFNGNDVFDFVSASKGSSGITVVYKLEETMVDGWKTAATQAVHDAVMKSVTMTASQNVTAFQMSAARNGGTVTSTAKIDLSKTGDGNIPGFQVTTMLVARGTANMTITPYSSGGGSGSGGTTAYPVEVEEQEQGTLTSSYEKAAEGTIVTIRVMPRSGYRLGGLRVTDSRGNEIAVTANADGTYIFKMPNSKVTVEATWISAVADPDATGVSKWLNTDDHIAYMAGYDTGMFGPDNNVTRAQVAMMFYRLLNDQNVEITTSFSDVPNGTWYADAVNTLATLGIVAGVGGGRFEPDRAITRAEFATIISRFAQASTDNAIQFTDVPETYWAYSYITTAASYGWVTGYGNGMFGPADKITRAQAATMVNRMLGRLCDEDAIDNGAGRQFPDVPQSHWAWYEIAEATTAHKYQMNSDRTQETWLNLDEE